MTKRNLKFRLKDPMVLILFCLFVFLTAGMTMKACGKEEIIQYRIELDAAYGGDNTGLSGIINEADVNEKVINALEDLMVQDERFIVYRTHTAGSAASVLESAEKINKDKPDMVLSIHAAYSPSSSKSGTRLYPSLRSSAKAPSLKFAQEILDEFEEEEDWAVSVNRLYYLDQEDGTTAIVIRDYGDEINEEDGDVTWTLLLNTDVPCVIAEQFFISNKSDIDRWDNEEGYQLIAERYYSAFCDYFEIEEMEFEEPEESPDVQG